MVQAPDEMANKMIANMKEKTVKARLKQADSDA